MITIGSTYTVHNDCADYCLDVLPHKKLVKGMAGKKVTVISHDNNGSPEFRAYLAEDDAGNTAWFWARELIK